MTLPSPADLLLLPGLLFSEIRELTVGAGDRQLLVESLQIQRRLVESGWKR